MPLPRPARCLPLFLALAMPIFGKEDLILAVDARTRTSGSTTHSLPINGSVILGNPSLLTRITQPVVVSGTAMNAGRSASVPTILGSVVTPLSASYTLGLSVNPFYLGSEFTTDPVGTRVSIALAEKINELVSIGLTLHHDMEPDRKVTDGQFNVTAGLTLRPTSQASITVQIRDFLKAPAGQTARTSPSATLGLSYSVKEFVFGLDTRITPEAGQVDFSAGGETTLFHRILHLGIGFEYRRFIAPVIGRDSRMAAALIPSAGMGVAWGPFLLDYAVSADVSRPVFVPIHSLSASLRF